MKRMIKFPSIEQYRNIVKDVGHKTAYCGKDENGEPIFDYLRPKPTLTFTATEKIHGTNAAVCYNNIDGLWVQSRTNIITVEKDNMVCAWFVEQNKESWIWIIDTLAKEHDIDLDNYTISVYFEFCGGNIQKNSAVSGLDKRAIIFQHFKVSSIENTEESSKWYETYEWVEPIISNGVGDVEYKWISHKESNIFNIMDFPTYEFSIDFNNPEKSQNDLIKLVEEVIEPNSPVGKQFGIDGNIGEGIVCSYLDGNELLIFKVKGEKHSAKSKVKTLKPVDAEKLEKIDKCVEDITHDWRFEQALTEIFGSDYENTLDRKRIGEYLKWVASDTIKEESDIIAEYGFEPKEVMSKVQQKAKQYFFTVEQL